MDLFLDGSDFCIHSRRYDNSECGSVVDESSREEGINSILDGITLDGFNDLVDGVGFSREDGLIGLERDGAEFCHTEIGGDAVTLLDLDDVSRDEELGLDLLPLSISQYECGWALEFV